MPQIEELHTSTKAAAPGWSYVVDTGYDPSKAAINPSSRKRQRNTGPDTTSAGDLTLRQQTAIQRHIAELDRDNQKDVQIPVPKSKGNRKQTTNVKRILTSGKDFAYYVEEEQALLAQRGGPSAVSGPAETGLHSTVGTGAGAGAGDSKTKPAQRASKTPLARRKSAIVTAHPSSSEASPAPSNMGPPAQPQTQVQPSATASSSIPPPETSPVGPQNSDLLLAPPPVSSISDAEIEALLSAPPLSYNAARSAPPPASATARRVFCEICGYWGRVKCMKCGARVCGLDCRTAHDESRCLKFYA